jgi:hypothetical protein
MMRTAVEALAPPPARALAWPQRARQRSRGKNRLPINWLFDIVNSDKRWARHGICRSDAALADTARLIDGSATCSQAIFRGVIAAASLKHDVGRVLRVHPMHLPRRNCRGLIEAR